MKNVLLVVDTRNLSFCLGKTYGATSCKLDYQKYLEAAVGEDHLYRALAFGTNNVQDTYKFTSFLKKVGFETQFRNAINRKAPGEEIKSKHILCNVALTLSVCKFLQSGKIERVVIGSSDFEYVDLIKHVRNEGILCEVFACGIPRIVRDAASKWTEIGKELLYANDTVEAE